MSPVTGMKWSTNEAMRFSFPMLKKEIINFNTIIFSAHSRALSTATHTTKVNPLCVLEGGVIANEATLYLELRRYIVG
ncbi:hypothetical protein LMG33810_000603 [Carnimonas sp. LMG 33810]